MTKQEMIDNGLNLDVELGLDWNSQERLDGEEEDDFLVGKTCNPDAPEECESCQ